jgi:hypothetical protein
MRRVHYAWIIAGLTFVVLIVTAGIRATPGVLMVPLEAEFGWSRTTISAAIALNIALFRHHRTVRGVRDESLGRAARRHGRGRAARGGGRLSPR